MKKPKYLGIDLGGTKGEICLFDEGFSLLSSETVKTETLGKGSLTIVEGIVRLIRQYRSDSVIQVGIALKGVVKNGVVMASSLFGGLGINYPLVRRLERDLGLSVSLENDAKAQTLAELIFGQGKGSSSFVLLNVGTGISAGYVVGGRLIRGEIGNFGSISSLTLYEPRLGGVITIEQIVSGDGLSSIYSTLAGIKKEPSEIFAAGTGDEKAKLTVEVFTETLSWVLTALVKFYNPQKIILTGGVLKSREKFLDCAVESYQRKVFPFQLADVSVSTLEHAACLGALITDKEMDSQH